VSQRLPALKPKDVMRALRRAGFELHHVRGSHYVFKHAQSGRRVIVPHHNKDLKKGTLASIIEQAGTPTTEFLKLL
jgi:predicted RNA binding protein YcfA (HicA-like mRNA interferase family)